MNFEKAIDEVAANYASRGYTVVTNPKPEDLPPFARDFNVQLVGRMRDIGVLVAIKRNRAEFAADPEMSRYAEIAAAHPGWRFDFVLLEGDATPEGIRGATEPTLEQIERSLARVDELIQMGFLDPALLTTWSVFEAVMRMRLRAAGEPAGEETPPQDLINELVSSGTISSDEFAEVERANQLRNQLVHGFVAPNDHAQTVHFLVHMARRLIEESKTAGAMN